MGSHFYVLDLLVIHGEYAEEVIQVIATIAGCRRDPLPHPHYAAAIGRIRLRVLEIKITSSRSTVVLRFGLEFRVGVQGF